MLAVGDFLVSSSIHIGKVAGVEITSQHGGTCNLANPWGADQAVKVQIQGGPAKVMHGAVLTIATHIGERLTFAPAAD
jgi:hypothetical protein